MGPGERPTDKKHAEHMARTNPKKECPVCGLETDTRYWDAVKMKYMYKHSYYTKQGTKTHYHEAIR